MNQTIEIKLASIADLDALVIAGDALFDHPIKPERAKEFFADSRHHLAIALDQDKVVGFASGLHYVHPDKDPGLFISEVSVLDSYQSQGIGRQLVSYLLDHGATLDCQDMWLATEASNTPARKAYQAAGGVEDSEPVVLITFDQTPDDTL